MSLPVTVPCPHGRDAFTWLGDGPWLGDPEDPDYGNYPWVHSTTMTPGHLEVCDLKAFATPEEAGEVCVCGHPSHGHLWNPGPIGHEYKPVPCPCGCPDFRHRPEDIERWRASQRGRRDGSPLPVATVAVEAGVPEAGQLELFPVPAGARPSGRRRGARGRTSTVYTGGLL